MDRQPVNFCPGIFEPYKADLHMERWSEVFAFTPWKISFPDLMWGLGFEMDCFDGFMEKNPQFESTSLSDPCVCDYVLEVLKNSEVGIVGSFLFSYFRQKTHWDYTCALTPEEEQFVLNILTILEKKLIEANGKEKVVQQ